jgi:hypothetical protein
VPSLVHQMCGRTQFSKVPKLGSRNSWSPSKHEWSIKPKGSDWAVYSHCSTAASTGAGVSVYPWCERHKRFALDH